MEKQNNVIRSAVTSEEASNPSVPEDLMAQKPISSVPIIEELRILSAGYGTGAKAGFDLGIAGLLALTGNHLLARQTSTLTEVILRNLSGGHIKSSERQIDSMPKNIELSRKQFLILGYLTSLVVSYIVYQQSERLVQGYQTALSESAQSADNLANTLEMNQRVIRIYYKRRNRTGKPGIRITNADV